jgi:hypothetical protein
MVVVSSSLDVLINLSKYDGGRKVMLREECAAVIAATIAELIVIYKDKSAEIFAKGCSVLWTFAASANTFKQVCVKILLSNELI